MWILFKTGFQIDLSALIGYPPPASHWLRVREYWKTHLRQYDYILKLETVNAEGPLMVKNLGIKRIDYGKQGSADCYHGLVQG